jgi:uncharacterized protein (TIGR04255 family)
MAQKYEKNFLSKALFRIDTDGIQLGKLDEFKDVVKERFPMAEQVEAEKGEVLLHFEKGKEASINQERSKFLSWKFRSEDKKTSLLVSDDHILVEYLGNYQNSEEMLKDALVVSEGFKTVLTVKTIKRLGLRYINEIEIKENNPIEWGKYIDEKLLGGIEFAKSIERTLSRSMGQIALKEDDANIIFNYGIWNKDYPAKITDKQFVLDIDVFSSLPSDAEDFDLGSELKKLNQHADNIFEKSITDDLRDILKPINEESHE